MSLAYKTHFSQPSTVAGVAGAQPSLTDEVLARLCAQGMDLASLWQLLSDIHRDMRDAEQQLEMHRLLAAPPSDAPQQERQRLLQAQQDALEAAKEQVASLNLRLASVKEQIDEATQTLQHLSEQALPAAQAQDAMQQLEAAEAQRQKLEEELEQLRQGRKKLQRRDAQAQSWDLNHQTKRARLRVLQMNSNDTALSSGSGAADGAPGEAFAPPPHEAADVQALVRQVRTALRRASDAGAVQVRGDDLVELKQSVGDFFGTKLRNADPNAYLQFVMRQAYDAGNEDLRAYALRLECFNNVRRDLREELQRARLHLSSHSVAGEGALGQSFTSKKFSTVPDVQRDGTPFVHKPQDDAVLSDAKGLQDYIKNLEDKLQSVGDDAQLCQLQLQFTSQRQQQSVQLLSGLSKQLHDTAMSIIRKLAN